MFVPVFQAMSIFWFLLVQFFAFAIEGIFVIVRRGEKLGIHSGGATPC